MILWETDEQEAARLATAEPGSISHQMSALPVNVRGVLIDRIIELPPMTHTQDNSAHHRLVVVPISDRNRNQGLRSQPPSATSRPIRLNTDHFECAVVYSEDPRYPVGGHRTTVHASVLVRGREVGLSL